MRGGLDWVDSAARHYRSTYVPTAAPIYTYTPCCVITMATNNKTPIQDSPPHHHLQQQTQSTQKFNKKKKTKMHRFSPETFHQFKVKRAVVLWRISTLRRRFGSFCHRFLACWMLNSSAKYRHHRPSPAVVPSSPPPAATDLTDVVPLKISLFGDPCIGKTSFLTKYAGGGKSGENEVAVTGIKHVDKTLDVKGARICYSIWEVGGDLLSNDQIPAACKDSVAMLFMFDLTSRCTLKNVIRWYQEARTWNQSAIAVLIGTKFDDFIQLPLHLQWTIAKQARAYAKALNATLFFSSATYNINVNKIFKYITAKLLNLDWNLERNLTIGEPIIDF